MTRTMSPRTAARGFRIRTVDLATVLVINVVAIGALWVLHGGPGQFASPAGILTGIGQIAALYGTLGALMGLLLMSRSPWLMEALGPDTLLSVHRWTGFATVWLLVIHGVFTTVGFAMASHSNPIAEFVDLNATLPFVLLATVSLGLFVAVAITSVRASRRELSYETWHGIHLYAYLAIALGFAHQLVVGSDFIDDPIARIYWIGLYVATIGAILAFRFGRPIMTSLRHRLRVANVVEEAPGVASIYLTGRWLAEIDVRAGQYFVMRFLTRVGWWRAHPFSISAQPNGRWLRITLKNLGDDSNRLLEVPVGTAVFIEGPYGILRADRRRRSKVLLVAGGIGIAPLRALLEELSGFGTQVTLLYRTSRPHEIVFRRELEALGRRAGVTIHYLVGRRFRDLPDDPLAARSLRRLVPAIREHDVYLCGPLGMMDEVRRTLLTLRVPPAQVHLERFST